jgi:hypothetical protein
MKFGPDLFGPLCRPIKSRLDAVRNDLGERCDQNDEACSPKLPIVWKFGAGEGAHDVGNFRSVEIQMHLGVSRRVSQLA